MPGKMEDPKYSGGTVRLVPDIVISKRQSVFGIVSETGTVVYSADTFTQALEWFLDRDHKEIKVETNLGTFVLQFKHPVQ